MAEGSTTERTRPTAAAMSRAAAPAPVPVPSPAAPGPLPFVLDFYPLEDAKYTRLSAFFEALRAGRLTTTKCAKDGLHWPPRAVCPTCHSEELVWVDLPQRGTVYAFSAVLAGAPMGMEGEVPFVVGLVDLEGTGLRIFTRLVGRPWTDCRVGQTVALETYQIPDGRSFYRFRSDVT